jgi:hypothetical protein
MDATDHLVRAMIALACASLLVVAARIRFRTGRDEASDASELGLD